MVLLSLCVCSADSALVDLDDWSSGGWRVQVDGVMGGRSSGDLQKLSDGAVFSGDININGGGFANIERSFSAKDLSGYAGIWVEVDVITADLVGGVAEPPQGVTLALGDTSRNYPFTASFAVPQGTQPGERASVFLPLSSFTKQLLRGCGNCKLDSSQISEVSVYVLYQPGPFSVTLRNIKAVETAGDIPVPYSTTPVMDMSDSEVRSMIETSIARGSTAYNNGMVAVCGAIYDSTMRTISKASGPASAVKQVADGAIDKAAPFDVNRGDEAAWIHRRGFDNILSAYKGESPPSESDYPAVAAGDWAVIKSASVPQVNGTAQSGLYTGSASLSSTTPSWPILLLLLLLPTVG